MGAARVGGDRPGGGCRSAASATVFSGFGLRAAGWVAGAVTAIGSARGSSAGTLGGRPGSITSPEGRADSAAGGDAAGAAVTARGGFGFATVAAGRTWI